MMAYKDIIRVCSHILYDYISTMKGYGDNMKPYLGTNRGYVYAMQTFIEAFADLWIHIIAVLNCFDRPFMSS